MSDRNNWFEDFFHGVANDLWRKCVSPEQTRTEADFLEKTLGKKARLLDLPCGNGRHSLELARRGCGVTGVDLSREFVAEAKATAKAAGLRAEFVAGDMGALRWTSEFDGVCCMGNSFGYLEYPEMEKFIRGVERALKPGGRFVIETGAAAESLLPTLKERVWYQVDDILFAEEHRYLADISCLETEAMFVRDGKTEVRKWWQWVYTVAEIRRLLGQAGLTIRELYGSHDGHPFKLGNPLLLVVAEKPAARPRKQRAPRKP
jgi:SAM-dependent methyltransferase